MRYGTSAGIFVVRLDKGEELVASLLDFCRRKRIRGATVSAIGAVSGAEIAVYDPAKKAYGTKAVRENCEIVSASGFVSVLDNAPHAHIHMALAGPDFRVIGGHLKKAVVNPTCEMAITPLGRLERKKDAKTGLALLGLRP